MAHVVCRSGHEDRKADFSYYSDPQTGATRARYVCPACGSTITTGPASQYVQDYREVHPEVESVDVVVIIDGKRVRTTRKRA
jgi:hypothetical protein